MRKLFILSSLLMAAALFIPANTAKAQFGFSLGFSVPGYYSDCRPYYNDYGPSYYSRPYYDYGYSYPRYYSSPRYYSYPRYNSYPSYGYRYYGGGDRYYGHRDYGHRDYGRRDYDRRYGGRSHRR